MEIQHTVDLREISMAVIRAGQYPSGAYVASPTFSQYGYSWMRDGAWIAHAMLTTGQYDSATAFHRWAIRTVLHYESRINALLGKVYAGLLPEETDYMPTRFTVDSTLGVEVWPDFQLDGYGAWLWVLVQHCRQVTPALWNEALPAVRLLVRYLEVLWKSPNYDCWEEHRDQVHTSTLAALYGGLQAVNDYAQRVIPDGLTAEIKNFVLTYGVDPSYGGLSKFIPASPLPEKAVDASLLWCAVPFGLLPVDSPVFQATLARIERDLHVNDGGVYRYRGDTYFGGSEWLLLTAWLGWVYVELGRLDEARVLHDWIEAQATSEGYMPEQVHNHMLDASYYEGWVQRWGTSACPLLWSHAMYLILNGAIKAALPQ